MNAAPSERDRALQERMHKLNVREEDLEESFIRSSGPGGQNVNKVATCVRLDHRPTGLQVKCQKTRSQKWNRYWARVWLLDEIERLREEKERRRRQ